MRQLILGIETTCDDTALAIVNTNHQLIAHKKISSAKLQAIYGGVVPELAARKHAELILPMLIDLMKEYQINQSEIIAIAYSSEPGLPGCLLVAKIFAQAIEFCWEIPIIPVNHVYGHIFSIGLTEKITFPFISLVASGKTTSLFLVESYTQIQLLNKTLDNAIGEVYDKVGRMLGLNYPAGPAVDQLATIKKDLPLLAQYPAAKNDFSFSGVLTATQIFFQKLYLNELDKKILVASAFQKWVITVVSKKIEYYAKQHQCNTVAIAGGVAANSYLREKIQTINLKTQLVAMEFSGDNAAMIAYYGSFLLEE